MSAVDIFVARAIKEEGIREFAYDDATGQRVKAPTGNLTWGIGFNLDQCGSAGLFQVMLGYLVGVIEQAIAMYPWYMNADDVRRSVFLDVAYNGGTAGLLKYTRMLEAATVGDWDAASKECAVANPYLDASRYAPLRALLLQGVGG